MWIFLDVIQSYSHSGNEVCCLCSYKGDIYLRKSGSTVSDYHVWVKCRWCPWGDYTEYSSCLDHTSPALQASGSYSAWAGVKMFILFLQWSVSEYNLDFRLFLLQYWCFFFNAKILLKFYYLGQHLQLCLLSVSLMYGLNFDRCGKVFQFWGYHGRPSCGSQDLLLRVGDQPTSSDRCEWKNLAP